LDEEFEAFFDELLEEGQFSRDKQHIGMEVVASI
jgi:hypothetical protein